MENFPLNSLFEQPLTIKHHHLPLEDRDGLAINNELAILMRDITRVPAVGGVILEHVDLGGRCIMMGKLNDLFPFF